MITIHAHAQQRLRQRIGLQSLRSMISWATAKKMDGQMVRKQPDGKIVYAWGDYELVFTNDEKMLITVVDRGKEKDVAEMLGEKVAKEARKLLAVQERLLRKAEINVAEITLNMLKARNPKIKAKLNEKLTIATDERDNIKTEVIVIRKAAEKYGVTV
jgi:hypothetical protein